jgi:hypothetical protein
VVLKKLEQCNENENGPPHIKVKSRCLNDPHVKHIAVKLVKRSCTDKQKNDSLGDDINNVQK